MKSFLKTASRAVSALFAVAIVTMGVASPAFADDVTGTVTSTITNARTGKTYDKLADATADAHSGDTIKLGEGNYTLYKVSSEGHTKGKDRSPTNCLTPLRNMRPVTPATLRMLPPPTRIP